MPLVALLLAFGTGSGLPSATLGLNVFLAGFLRGDISRSLSTLIDRFFNHRVGELTNAACSVKDLPATFAADYAGLLDGARGAFHVEPDSPLVNLFYDVHSKSVIRPGSPKYSLFVVNVSSSLPPIRYGRGPRPLPCHVLSFRAAFCQVSLNSTSALPQLFNHTATFVEEFLTPLGSFEFIPPTSRVIIPIVTFGPAVTTSSLQSQLHLLFPSLETVVVVNHQNIYDFPVVATAQMSSRFVSLFDALHSSAHAFAPSMEGGFAATDRVSFVYIFPSAQPSRIELDGNISLIFCNEPSAEPLVLRALVQMLGGLTAELSFGGHHPLHPLGGASAFSPLLSDTINRNVAIAAVRQSNWTLALIKNVDEKIAKINLPFLNISIWRSARAEVLEKVNRTLESISAGELPKALSSGWEGLELAREFYLKAVGRLHEATLFAQCCPETVHISTPPNRTLIGAIIVTFLVVSGLIGSKFYGLWRKKRFGIPTALIF
jgi:hypothetical protein